MEKKLSFRKNPKLIHLTRQSQTWQLCWTFSYQKAKTFCSKYVKDQKSLGPLKQLHSTKFSSGHVEGSSHYADDKFPARKRKKTLLKAQKVAKNIIFPRTYSISKKFHWAQKMPFWHPQCHFFSPKSQTRFTCSPTKVKKTEIITKNCFPSTCSPGHLFSWKAVSTSLPKKNLQNVEKNRSKPDSGK